MRSEEGDAGLLQELRKLRQKVSQIERRLNRLARGRPPAEEERIRTFVEGFDEALGGGVPAGHVVIIRGPTGAMKTSLSLYMASRNRDKGMSPLFISLEEDRESLLRTMRGLGMGEEDFIVDIATMRAEHGLIEEAGDWLQILMSYLTKKVEAGVDLLVIDPFNSLYEGPHMGLPRSELFQFFKFLRGSGVTTFLVFEEEGLADREDYMADGVLEMTLRELERGQVALWIRCVKMRHTDHSRDYYQLEFRRDRFLAFPIAR
jgi:KaiC/GvpD/RAD55 family RecA-like ATPase